MTDATIHTKIARAIEIKRIQANLDAELRDLKALIVGEAETRHEEQRRTHGGGWSWHHPDLDGNIVRVTQPAPKLKARLDPEGGAMGTIKTIAGRSFPQLFLQVPAYAPVEEFRTRALAALPQGEAKKLIRLCTADSPVAVAFEVAEGIE